MGVRRKVRSITIVVFEGVPGIGKSTLTTMICKELQKKHPDVLLYFNYKPLVSDNMGEETVIHKGKHETKMGFDFLRGIYNPEEKGFNMLRAITVAGKLAEIEMKFKSQFEVDPVNGVDDVINIVERNTATAAGVFIASNHYNMRLGSDVPEAYKHSYDADWKSVEPLRDNMACVARAVLAGDVEGIRYVLFFMQGEGKAAQERVVSRGREWESAHLSVEYMEVLKQYQTEFEGMSPPTRAIPWFDIYSTDNTSAIYFNVDRYRATEEYPLEEAVKDMKIECLSILNPCLFD